MFKAISKFDVFVALYLAVAIILFIIPIPSAILDILLAFNISLAMTIMFGALFCKEVVQDRNEHVLNQTHPA